VIEKLPVNNRIEAAIRERYWVEFYEAKLNKQIPSRPQKEYRAKYIIDHDEKIKEVSAKYRVDNIEKIKEYQNTKHTCTCGGHYTTANRSYHLKTKKHTSFKATE
jgi:hypothetical protein